MLNIRGFNFFGRKSGLVGSKLDLQSKGRGFESYRVLDGHSVKAMSGSIPVHPILVHSIQENLGSQMGHTKKNRGFNFPGSLGNVQKKYP